MLCRRVERGADGIKKLAADAGAISPLVTLLVSPSPGVQERSAGALWNLALHGKLEHGVVSHCRL